MNEEKKDLLNQISMLDQAFNVEENSRLGCQIEFSDDLDGILVELAPE